MCERKAPKAQSEKQAPLRINSDSLRFLFIVLASTLSLLRCCCNRKSLESTATTIAAGKQRIPLIDGRYKLCCWWHCSRRCNGETFGGWTAGKINLSLSCATLSFVTRTDQFSARSWQTQLKVFYTQSFRPEKLSQLSSISCQNLATPLFPDESLLQWFCCNCNLQAAVTFATFESHQSSKTFLIAFEVTQTQYHFGSAKVNPKAW